MSSSTPPTPPSTTTDPRLQPIQKPYHTIITERLILRTPQIRDAPAYLHIHTNPANTAFDPFPVDASAPALSIPHYEAVLIPKFRAMTARGDRAFMVIALRPRGGTTYDERGEAQNDVVIGVTGFNEFSITRHGPGGEGEGEGVLSADIGAMVDAPAFTGKGYAKEALLALIRYGFEALGCDVLTAETVAGNKPFRAVMRAVGFGEGVEVGGGEDERRNGRVVREAVYKVGREEWMRWRNEKEGDESASSFEVRWV